MALKITKEKASYSPMYAKDLKDGTIFSFTQCDWKEEIYMKIRIGLVCLDDGDFFSKETAVYREYPVGKIYENTELILKI